MNKARLAEAGRGMFPTWNVVYHMVHDLNGRFPALCGEGVVPNL